MRAYRPGPITTTDFLLVELIDEVRALRAALTPVALTPIEGTLELREQGKKRGRAS